MTLPLMEMSPTRLSDSHSSGDEKPRVVGWTRWPGNWDESHRKEPGKRPAGGSAPGRRRNRVLKVSLVTALRGGRTADGQHDERGLASLKGARSDLRAERGKGVSLPGEGTPFCRGGAPWGCASPTWGPRSRQRPASPVKAKERAPSIARLSELPEYKNRDLWIFPNS